MFSVISSCSSRSLRMSLKACSLAVSLSLVQSEGLARANPSQNAEEARLSGLVQVKTIRGNTVLAERSEVLQALVRTRQEPGLQLDRVEQVGVNTYAIYHPQWRISSGEMRPIVMSEKSAGAICGYFFRNSGISHTHFRVLSYTPEFHLRGSKARNGELLYVVDSAGAIGESFEGKLNQGSEYQRPITYPEVLAHGLLGAGGELRYVANGFDRKAGVVYCEHR